MNNRKFLDYPCPHCGSLDHGSKGYNRFKKKYDRICGSCGKRFYISEKDAKEFISDSSTIDSKVRTDIQFENNQASVFIQTDIIQDIDTLLKTANIDREEWILNKSDVKTWSVPYKNEDQKMVHKQMYSVSGKLEKRKPDSPIVPVINPVRIEVIGKIKKPTIKQTDIKRTIILGDAQVGYHRDVRTSILNPFHDRKAIDNVLQILEIEQPDEIIIIGDMLDVTEASKFTKKPEFYFTMQPAINELGWIIGKIRSICPEAKVVYHQGNHESYEKNTEVLTRKEGWKKISLLNLEDEIIQYNISNKNFSYSKPLNISSHEAEELIHLESWHHKQVVTLNHDVIYKNEKIKAYKLLEIGDLKQKDFPLFGKFDQLGIDLSDELIKLLVWVVSDATMIDETKYGKKNSRRVQFKLSKERKINRLKSLLNKLNFNYTYKICNKTGCNKLQPYYIRIYGKYARFIFNLLNSKKEYPDFFKNLNSHQTKILLKELSKTDGNKKDNRISYSSINKKDIDLLQEVLIKNNYITKVYTKNYPASGFNSIKKQYILVVFLNLKCNYKINIKKIRYNDQVYCVEVPDGAILTRHGGKIGISGNCRMSNYLIDNMMFAYQLKEFNSDREIFSLPHMIGLDQFNIEFISEYPGGEYWINDELRTLHGNVINLKKELEVSKTSFIMGHIHKILKETRTVFDRYGRNAIMGTSIGCLCKIDGTVPAYTKNVNWQQGIAYVESDKKHFNFHHIYINDGKSIFKGQIYQGQDYEDEIKDLLYLK
jgi:transcription elongation factor Elf1